MMSNENLGCAAFCKTEHKLPIRQQSGFTLLELAMIVGLIAVLAAVAIPIYLNYETRAKTAEPMEMFDTFREQVAIEVATRDGLLRCDNNLVDQANLKSSYMHLDIEPIALDNTDASKGYGAVLHVVSKVGDNGVEGVQVTKEFYHELEKHQPKKLYPKASIFTDSFVIFPVLLTDLNDPVCHGGKTHPSTMTSGTASSTTTTSTALLSSQKHVVTGPQSTTQPKHTVTRAQPVTQKPASDYENPNPTPVKNAVMCSGVICGFRDVKTGACTVDKPYAFTSVINKRDGTKSIEKGCQSKDWCQSKWWQETSGESLCTFYDFSQTYNFDQTCHYCYKKDGGNSVLAGPPHSHQDAMFTGK